MHFGKFVNNEIDLQKDIVSDAIISVQPLNHLDDYFYGQIDSVNMVDFAKAFLREVVLFKVIKDAKFPDGLKFGYTTSVKSIHFVIIKPSNHYNDRIAFPSLYHGFPWQPFKYNSTEQFLCHTITEKKSNPLSCLINLFIFDIFRQVYQPFKYGSHIWFRFNFLWQIKHFVHELDLFHKRHS